MPERPIVTAIEKTRAVALRVTPFSRTSHVVTWYTPNHGRITTLVKGACRPKSPFLGQYDLYYTCELLYYSREQRGMPIAKECVPIETREALRHDWRAALCAGYAAGLTVFCSPPGELIRGHFAVIERLFDSLAESGPRRALMPWFELQLLGNLGLAPRLASCTRCGTDITATRPMMVVPRQGGAVCRRCESGGAEGPRLTLSAEAMGMLRDWQRNHSPRTAAATPDRSEAWLESCALLGILLVEHLGIASARRQAIVEMLGRGVP